MKRLASPCEHDLTVEGEMHGTLEAVVGAAEGLLAVDVPDELVFCPEETEDVIIGPEVEVGLMGRRLVRQLLHARETRRLEVGRRETVHGMEACSLTRLRHRLVLSDRTEDLEDVDLLRELARAELRLRIGQRIIEPERVADTRLHRLRAAFVIAIVRLPLRLHDRGRVLVKSAPQILNRLLLLAQHARGEFEAPVRYRDIVSREHEALPPSLKRPHPVVPPRIIELRAVELVACRRIELVTLNRTDQSRTTIHGGNQTTCEYQSSYHKNPCYYSMFSSASGIFSATTGHNSILT